MARANAAAESLEVDFEVMDVRDLAYRSEFDLVMTLLDLAGAYAGLLRLGRLCRLGSGRRRLALAALVLLLAACGGGGASSAPTWVPAESPFVVTCNVTVSCMPWTRPQWPKRIFCKNSTYYKPDSAGIKRTGPGSFYELEQYE